MEKFFCRIVFAQKASGVLSAFNGKPDGEYRFENTDSLTAGFVEAEIRPGSFATICTVRRKDQGGKSFSFFLRDVSDQFPVYVPLAGAAVVPAEDTRTYREIADFIAKKGLQSDFEQMNHLPEESAAHAFGESKCPPACPVWLGLGRDPRIFEVAPRMLEISQTNDFQYWGSVLPLNHSMPVKSYDAGHSLLVHEKFPDAYRLIFAVGPGSHCAPRLSRRLLEGWMPVLTSVQDERSIRYEVTIFTTNESGPVSEETIAGADLETAYTMAWGCAVADAKRKSILEKWNDPENATTVCAIRVKAVNTTSAPAYAWFKAPEAEGSTGTFESGFSFCEALWGDRVLAVSTLDRLPLRDAETSILVQPGESHTFEMWIPHIPLRRDRAEKFLSADWDTHFAAAKRHWRTIAESAAQIDVPEPAIDERVKAGLLHLETLLTGPRENDRGLLANCGVYGPIGTESSPIIQYLDSMGWHDKARRAIEFFLLERQKENGFIQCYFDYQSETGPVLFTAGEHYRHTRDDAWLRKMFPRLKRSCDFLIEWNHQNKTEENRRKGCYGLASGKVADPEDFFHAFFLNAGNYAGLERMSQVLEKCDGQYAAFLKREVAEYRENLNAALEHAIACAPVYPMADGSWVPAVPAWPEHHGATVLFAEGGSWHTHGCFAGRDTFVGPLWLIYAGVCAPRSYPAEVILQYNQHPQTLHNAALSQPYYSRHDYAHLLRGEVKLFLQAYYHQMAALQDRETYTFWEHYFLVTPHKTHEEAWFLMQSRWMLWLEPDMETLRLFAGAPRAWFAAGKTISVRNAHSYFGKLNFQTQTGQNFIRCEWRAERFVPHMEIRLPHPEGRRALSCVGGNYDADNETVLTAGNNGVVELKFE